jgi:uncharacterized protein (DUF1499 family)
MVDVATTTSRRSRVAVAGFLLAVVSLLALAAAGPASRFGIWSFRAGFQLMTWAAYASIGALIVSLVGVVIARPGGRSRGLATALLGLAISLLVLAVPLRLRQAAGRVPPIHDISTDTDDPPSFEAMLPLRADAANPATYGGPDIAAQQHRAYPEIAPLVLDVTPQAAFVRALGAARNMGWMIVSSDPTGGRIEATATTLWFGFKDDVVVRIRPDGANSSRIDVRSVSRVGRSDVGANAARIRKYLRLVAASRPIGS